VTVPEDIAPRPRKRRIRPRVSLLILLLLISLVAAAVLMDRTSWYERAPENDPIYGVDFSCRQTEWLGEDCKQAYAAIVEQLPVRHIRISAYWDEIEPSPGQFDFSSIDWQVDEAARNGVKVTLSVGIKGQRWPEFFIPAWVKAGRNFPGGSTPVDYPDIAAEALNFVQATVEHESGQPTVEVFQVENEPYVHFWQTVHDWSLPPWFVAEEAQTMRAADPLHRPLMVTHASWLRTDASEQKILAQADIYGDSVYTKRQRGPLSSIYLYPFHLGPLTPDLPEQEKDAVRQGKALWIDELQAEPFEAPWVDIRKAETCTFPSMSPDRLQTNLTLADRSGAERAYLWGAEWWYFCRTHLGDNAMWNAVSQALATSAEREQTTLPTGFVRR
jgi:hypothetical protein